MSVMKFSRPLAFALIPLALAGCSHMPWDDDEDSSGAAEKPIEVKWVRVGENPPTYHPEGMDRSQPTDAFHGEWIIDHDTGSRYFVPTKGAGEASRRQLTKDALSRCSQPSAVGEVIDKTVEFGGAAAETVATGIDKITPKFGGKKKGKDAEAEEPAGSDSTPAP